MKQLLSILLLFINLTLYSQHKFLIGINYTPIYSKNIYHRISSSESLNGLKNLNKYDNWDYGYITGVSLSYGINDRFSFTGEMNFKKINDIYYSDLPYYYNIAGVMIPTYPSNKIKTSTNLDFFSIPLGINYVIIDLNKVFKISINPLLAPEFLLNTNNSESQFKSNHSKINLIFNFGILFSYVLSNDFILTLSPEYGITINKINQIEFENIEYCDQRNQYTGIKIELEFIKK
jgi:hypothetical protein